MSTVYVQTYANVHPTTAPSAAASEKKKHQENSFSQEQINTVLTLNLSSTDLEGNPQSPQYDLLSLCRVVTGVSTN